MRTPPAILSPHGSAVLAGGTFPGPLITAEKVGAGN